MTIRLTHDEARTVVLIEEAIAPMNALVIHLRQHNDVLPGDKRLRVYEADFMLNTVQDTIINDDEEMLA